METLTRPNGKPYRPRKPPRAEVFYDWDGYSGVVVIGTHDPEKAADMARPLWEHDEPLPSGVRGWWRLVPWCANGEYDRSWVDAPARGQAVVIFRMDWCL